MAAFVGVYTGAHHASGHPLFTLGFSGFLQMKAWLASAATLLMLVQLGTALWTWGRPPRVRTPAPT